MDQSLDNKAIVVVGIVVAACLCCCGLTFIYSRVSYKVAQADLERTAQRIGVEPTLDGIAGYINKSIEPGMSRDQVEEILSDIAPIEVKRGEPMDFDSGWGVGVTCDQITLKIGGPLFGEKWPMKAFYDNQGKLVVFQSASEGVPRIDIVAP
jgi:hypothetical protein